MSQLQKTFVIIGVIFLAALGGVAYFHFIEKRADEAKSDTDAAISFYNSLHPKFRDCGNEVLDTTRDTYNPTMRECFFQAFKRCALTKLQQRAITEEGDPIFTTVVIEGEGPRGCGVHLYIDNRDRFGKYGTTDTICYTPILDRGSGQQSLLFHDCEDGTQRFLY